MMHRLHSNLIWAMQLSTIRDDIKANETHFKYCLSYWFGWWRSRENRSAEPDFGLWFAGKAIDQKYIGITLPRSLKKHEWQFIHRPSASIIAARNELTNIVRQFERSLISNHDQCFINGDVRLPVCCMYFCPHLAKIFMRATMSRSKWTFRFNKLLSSVKLLSCVSVRRCRLCANNMHTHVARLCPLNASKWLLHPAEWNMIKVRIAIPSEYLNNCNKRACMWLAWYAIKTKISDTMQQCRLDVQFQARPYSLV